MGNRYSRVRQGAQLNQAQQNYITYQSTPRIPNLNSQGPRDLSKIVYVTPFTVDLATDEVVSVRMNPAHFTRLGARVNTAGTGGQVDETPGANSVVNIGGFRSSRVVLFHNATRVVSVATSQVTQSRYLRYAGDRFSCPFGRNLATDDEGDVFQAIKAAILAAETGQIRRVSWTRERTEID